MSPTIAVSIHDGIVVVRDDTLPGGTKSRAADTLLRNTGRDVVYASPAYGYAQVALAHAAETAGKIAHIFVAARKTPHPRTTEAARAGAVIHQVRPGYLTQTQAAARTWAAARNATLLPFGFDTPDFRQALTGRIRAAVAEIDPAAWDGTARQTAATIREPAEVWVAAGSGTLTRALQDVWPDADHHAVAVGRHPDAGRATLHAAPEPFERDAKYPPPYPSTSNFDAKVWRFARGRGPGTLIWNVAG